MPVGAAPGGVDGFETVVANVIGPTDGHDSHSAAFTAGGAADERDLEVRIASPITAPTAMRPRATSHSNFPDNNSLGGLGFVVLDVVCFFIALRQVGTQM